MSRFVSYVPAKVRYVLYLVAILAAIEMIASLLAAILFTALIVSDGSLDAFLADPVGITGTMILGFQTFVLEAEAIRYAFEPYVDTRSAAIVVGACTTLYVVSMILVGATLRRMGVRNGRDVDAYLRGRKA